jgi:hypothetical protein
VGTDKPTWLGDFNEAMSDIDAGMHENATDIATMQSDVSTATAAASQASSDVATLTGTVNTLSGTVSSVQTTANNASQTASSALNTANTANGKADTNANAITSINTAISDLNDKVDESGTYSTTETKIGTWIDGKPIYRKVIEYTMPSTVGNYPTVDTGILNVENMFITIERQYGANNSQYVSAITGYNGYFEKSNGIITFNRTNTDATKAEAGKYNIILEYTKTTD